MIRPGDTADLGNPGAGKFPGGDSSIPDATGDSGGAGDGFNHFQLDENESGFHYMHTAPDGTVTEGDPSSIDEAQQEMSQCMGGGEPDADDLGADDSQPAGKPSSSSAGPGPDLSGIYSS